jgi:hypothetical protein
MFATPSQDKALQEIWESAEKGAPGHLLRNEVVMQILRNRGYTPEFIKHCEARREKILQALPASGTA